MADLHVWDNFAGAWSEATINNTTQYAVPWKTDQAGYVVALRWYRKATGTLRKPEALSLWDTTDQSRKEHLTSLTDSGAAGWQETALAAPFAPVVGREYRVCVSIPSNNYQAYFTLGTAPTPPYPLAYGATKRAYVQAADGNYPNTTDSTYLQGVDVAFNLSGGSSTPVTTGYLDPALAQVVSDIESYVDSQNAQILSMVSNESTPSPYSIPNQIKTSVGADLVGDVAAVASDVGDILTSVGTGLGTAVSAIQTSVGTSLNAVATAAKNAAEAVSPFATTAFQWEEDFFNAIYGATGWDAANYGVKMANTLGNLFKWIGSLGRSGAVPATGWTNTATTAWVGGIAWATPADLYVVTITTAPAEAGSTVTEGLTMYRRGGWWAPLNSTQVGERHYLDWATNEIMADGRSFPGIELHYGPGWEGTIDAWEFTG